MSTPQDIPDNVTSAIVPAGTLLLFVGQDDQGNTPIYVKNPNDTYSEVGGGHGQKTINGLFLSNGSVWISKGVTFNDFTYSGTSIWIYNGGVMNRGKQLYGTVYVYDGGKVISTTINGEWIFINNDGEASSTTVNWRGSLGISSGGSSDNSLINQGGYIRVQEGGVATNIIENGGRVEDQGGSLSFVSNTISGRTFQSAPNRITIHSNTVMSSCTLNYGATPAVYDGGRTVDININRGASLQTFGGTAENISVNGSGHLRIFGGSFTNIVINQGGNCRQTSPNAMTINSALVKYGGSMSLNYGGGYRASNITIQRGARITFGITPSTYVQGTYDGSAFEIDPSNSQGFDISGMNVRILSAAILNSVSIHSGTELVAVDEGIASSPIVYPGGILTISSTGCAWNIKQNGGYVSAWNTGNFTFMSNTFSNAVIDWGMSASIHSGTVASDITISSGGNLYVYSGGTAYNVDSKAGAYVSSASGAVITYVTPQ